MRSFSIAMVAACPFPANHGTPGLIRETSQAISALGHKVHVVTYPMGQDIPVQGLTIHRVSGILTPRRITVGPTYYKPFLDALLVVKLCRVVAKEKIDIIHAHNYEGALAGYIAKKVTGRPMIYNAVNTMRDELPTYGFIRPKFLAIQFAALLDNLVPRMGDHVIAISEDLHRDLLQKGIRNDRLSLVPAGVDAALFENKDPNVMRSRYKIGSRPLVVYTGTLDTFQRIDLLLIAMRLVIDKIPEAMLLIAGNIIRASDLAQFSDLARELGIAPNVIFTDERPLEEMPYFLASADVAVAPRPSCPGFPIKLLNYMAAAKPIVVFHGSAKGLQNMQNAIVVPDQDSQEYGRAILTILQDPPLALALGSNARQTVQRTFDWPTLARKIERIYAELGP